MSGTDDTLRVRPGVDREVPAAGEALPAGALVGEYVVVKGLATGGHGEVYLAEHRALGRRAAIKVLRHELATSAEMAARFVREARAVNLVRHPNIIDIYDLGVLDDGRPFCVMELLPGRPLDAVVKERGALPPAEAVEYLAGVCQALEAAHQAGVVHRDVKASNVMVLDERLPPRLKLLDFGIAKVADPREQGLTAVGRRLGTSSAMAPEQVRGEPVDRRADVYALGVLLHQLLTGQVPFPSDDAEEVERMHLQAPPPRPSALARVPPALDAVVIRCLQKSPDRRYQSAAAVLEAARAAAPARAAAALRRAPAVAIHVAIRPAAPDDESALLSAAGAAEAAEAALRGAGFSLPIATTGAVLGVLPLPADAAAARTARAAALDLASGLPSRLAGPGLEVSVCLHAGEADVRDTSGGVEVAGGPVCQTSQWVAEPPGGFAATPEALAGLGS
ncbi:MAG TPA: serine/threonine-protein kinase [Anaeromyxobacteraceae bacterium]|nr:serine/threonine-protein kinase [Anaeromyxobacteraceae bacterium]